MVLLLTDKKITIRLSVQVEAQIKWWINNIDNSCRHINIPNPDINIYTAASLSCWGITDGMSPIQGTLV